MNKKIFIYGISIAVVVILILVSPTSVVGLHTTRVKLDKHFNGDGITEYRAVLIGVEYKWCKNVMQIPFYKNVEYMYNLLLVSDHWQADHIKLLINKNATIINIIKALLWLDRRDDGDDVSLVYYTGHGGNLNNVSLLNRDIDLLPVDEEDGYDEFLTTYWTALNPFAIMTDDLFNFLLDRLDSKGIAVIIDSCYSGGMIDSDKRITKFLGGKKQDGRVTMTCCKEHETGFGVYFAQFIIKGLQGYADEISEGGNNDGFVSAEEVFTYADLRYREWINEFCHPVLDDRYDGELQLAEVNFPPTTPAWIDGYLIGETNIVYTFTVLSTDPEGHNIRYGWDWDVKGEWHECSNTLDAEVDDWSLYYLSEEHCSMSHLWDKPGIYDIRVKSQDEKGAEIVFPNPHYGESWSDDQTIIITSDNEIVDQFQLVDRNKDCIDDVKWCAQSFIPTSSTLSKITLELYQRKSYPVFFDISIRSNLTGSDLIKLTMKVEEIDYCNWIEFDFPDLMVTPGETYYIILRSQYNDSYNQLGWFINQNSTIFMNDPDSYPRGEGYISYDSGKNWSCPDSKLDYCFVIYSPRS